MDDGRAVGLESAALGERSRRERALPGWLARLVGGSDSLLALYALHLWTLFGIALSSVLLGLAALTAPSWWARGMETWRRHRDLMLPLGAYVCLLLASTLLSRDPARSFSELGELLSLAAVPVGLVVLESARRARRIVTGVIAVAAILSVFGLSQLLVGYGVTHRIRGPFSIYMTFAGILLLADLLLISQMVYGRGWKSLWRWAALVPINLALLGSLTRSAWVALALTVALVLLARAPRLLPALVLAVGLGMIVAPWPVTARVWSIFDLHNPSNWDRLCMIESGAHMVADRPLFGIGPRMVEEQYPLYSHPTAVSQSVPHLHNTFVQLAAERGLLSLAAYLWLMGGAMVAAYRGWRRDRAEGGGDADLWVGAFTGLLALNLAGLFEYNWGDTEVQRLALFLVVLPFALRRVRADAAAPGAGSERESGSGPVERPA